MMTSIVMSPFGHIEGWYTAEGKPILQPGRIVRESGVLRRQGGLFAATPVVGDRPADVNWYLPHDGILPVISGMSGRHYLKSVPQINVHEGAYKYEFNFQGIEEKFPWSYEVDVQVHHFAEINKIFVATVVRRSQDCGVTTSMPVALAFKVYLTASSIARIRFGEKAGVREVGLEAETFSGSNKFHFASEDYTVEIVGTARKFIVERCGASGVCISAVPGISVVQYLNPGQVHVGSLIIALAE
jgi:hypothetical protein